MSRYEVTAPARADLFAIWDYIASRAVWTAPTM